MKIVLTGGNTGGHFYPIVGVIEAIREIEEQEKLVDIELYYAGDKIYDSRFFYDYQVTVKKIRTGKRRQYFSLKNFLDLFKTGFACLGTLWWLFRVFPDVVFSKGGATAFPVLLAARILRIPVLIHESDSVPGRTSRWSAKFAKSIAVSYPSAAEYFPKDKTVLTGNPLRKEILHPTSEGAREFLHLEEKMPLVAILGGSQGAVKINDAVLGALPELLPQYEVIHQVGENNIEQVEGRLEAILHNSPYRDRYQYFGHLDNLAMKMTAGAADIIVSRAGSSIFEIAAWGMPSIVIPIARSNGNHQVKNAYNYARSGAALVIEEANLTPHLLVTEIDKLMKDKAGRARMSEAAQQFSDTGAARKIAGRLIDIGRHLDEGSREEGGGKTQTGELKNPMAENSTEQDVKNTQK